METDLMKPKNNSQAKSATGITCVQWIVICIIIISVLASCGLKAPPRPPHFEPLVPITKIEKQIDGNLLRLVWQIPEQPENSNNRVKGFYVYRSRHSLDEDFCDECPITFERMTDISLLYLKPNQKKGDSIVYQEVLEQGYTYIDKVTGYGKDNTIGSDSEWIEFDF